MVRRKEKWVHSSWKEQQPEVVPPDEKWAAKTRVQCSVRLPLLWRRARAKVGKQRGKNGSAGRCESNSGSVPMSIKRKITSEREVTELEAELQRHAGDGGEGEKPSTSRKEKQQQQKKKRKQV